MACGEWRSSLVILCHYVGNSSQLPLGFWRHHILSAFTAGWSGVDLFFVLSGFLIGGILGSAGRVIAFEPSPRECRRLKRHIRVNWCRNVMLEQCALGDECGEAELYVVKGFLDWGNSLRPPAVAEMTEKVSVKVQRLDDVLAGRGIESVDLVKVDAEGAELGVLQGAGRILKTGHRPAMLIEVQDLRTRPWGYAAREITQLLAGWNYRWFSIEETGELRPVSANEASYDANLVALPEERVDEFRKRIETEEAG